MSTRRILAALLTLSIVVSGPGLARAGSAQPAPPAPPAGQPPPPPPSAPPGAQQPPPPPGTLSTQASPPAPGDPSSAPIPEVTPPRLSYLYGEVSFWRAGADDWAPATLNTPLAPGDILYAGPNGNIEIQVGPHAFVRAAYGTQVGLDNQEPEYIQFRVTGGQVALDLRGLPPSSTLEVDTPNAAFTVDRPGYYHLDVNQDSSRLGVYRGGSATMTPAGGAATPIASNQQLVVTGTESTQLALGAAPQLTMWDNWNSQRTAFLIQTPSARYVGPAVYGTESLDQYGRWRTVETYGSVWVPADVAPGWVPYSTGRWIWDPRFGWTWLDTAPWGWAPYHYGRWVFVGNYWAWAPGPIVARPVYAPALVVFLGGPTVVVGRPLYWAPLGWGEPVIPWWGRRGFVGVPWWGGWAGPRVVNNVVINRNTTVNVTNITVYRNVQVTNAVVGVPREQFGHGTAKPARIPQADLRQLAPVHGSLEIKPVAASVMPATGATVKPPAPIQARGVVATRPPHDPTSTLRENGLPATPAPAPAPAPQIVPPPKRTAAPPNVTSTPRPGPAPGLGTPQRPVPAPSSPAPRDPDDKTGGVPQRPRVPPSGPAKVPPSQGAVPSPQRPMTPPQGAIPGQGQSGVPPTQQEGPVLDSGRVPCPRLSGRPQFQGSSRAPYPRLTSRATPGPGGQRGRGQQQTRANQPAPPPAAEHQARREAPPRGQPQPREGSGQGERPQR